MNGALGMVGGVFHAFGYGAFESLIGVGQLCHTFILSFGVG